MSICPLELGEENIKLLEKKKKKGPSASAVKHSIVN